MTKKEVIKMYADWMSGIDERITMSDCLIACFEQGFDPKEIEKEAEKEIEGIED